MNGKRISIGCLFFLPIFFSLFGQYYLAGYEMHSTSLALYDLIYLSFIGLVGPTIFRIKNKEPFPYKKGLQICAINSGVVLLVSLLLYLLSMGIFTFIGVLGSLLFFFINMFLFSKSKKATIAEEFAQI